MDVASKSGIRSPLVNCGGEAILVAMIEGDRVIVAGDADKKSRLWRIGRGTGGRITAFP